jgi:hypothetical protein
LTLTATTTVPCHRCHPDYATVTVMLIGRPPSDSSGYAASISAPSPSIAPSNQPPTNGAGSPGCPGCGSPANENVGAWTVGIAVSPTSSPSIASSNQPPTNGAGPPGCPGCVGPANEIVGAETVGIPVGPGSSPSIASSNQPPTNGAGPPGCPGCVGPANENVGAEAMGIAVSPVSSPASPSSAAPANAQGSTYSGGPNTVLAGSSLTAASATANHGPYFMGGSERSLNIFRQTIALGVMLAVVVGLAML